MSTKDMANNCKSYNEDTMVIADTHISDIRPATNIAREKPYIYSRCYPYIEQILLLYMSITWFRKAKNKNQSFTIQISWTHGKIFCLKFCYSTLELGSPPPFLSREFCIKEQATSALTLPYSLAGYHHRYLIPRLSLKVVYL
jgi:hypothetical protein